MMTITATIKERNGHILTPSYTVDEAIGRNLPNKFFIEFWGLDQPDVEEYTLTRTIK